MRVSGCDAPQEKSPFCLKAPLRPEPLQCHFQGTRGCWTPTCTPQLCHPPPAWLAHGPWLGRAHRPLHSRWPWPLTPWYPQWPQNPLLQGRGSLSGCAGTALTHCLVTPRWPWVDTALAPTVAPA